MKNKEIAQIFRDIADILEIKGANVFRIRAYQRASQNIEGLTRDVADYAQEGKLREIPGVGADLAARISEYIQSGRIEFYEKLKKSIPSGLLDLLNIPGIGPKTAKLLYQERGIKNVSGLNKAIAAGKLSGLEGIKEKTIENIKKGIEIYQSAKEKMTLAQAINLAQDFLEPLKKLPSVEKITAGGSLRRCKESVRDIDLLAVSGQPQKLISAFVKLPLVSQVLAHGPTKSAIRTASGTQVDLRVVERKSFGSALVYFTGSKNFNIKLRIIGQKFGLKVNEYGIFSATKRGGSANNFGGKYICGASEEEVFKRLGLAYIPPELREDNGEIELAKENKLPRLVEIKDLRGDLHIHSTWSDGGNTIAEMARAAQARGYAYIAITDHSQSLRVANGLSVADLKKKKAEIEKINRGMKDFRVFFAAEVDIDVNGNLDYSDSVLKEFDLVVAAVHSSFKLPQDKMTKRLIKACKNKYVNIIAHPTGRLFGVRQASEVNFKELFKVARETNTHMEVSSFFNRLDLNDLNCRLAKEMGVKVAINTDSHLVEHLAAMYLGVAVARRGWLEKSDVINTRPLQEFLKIIKK